MTELEKFWGLRWVDGHMVATRGGSDWCVCSIRQELSVHDFGAFWRNEHLRTVDGQAG
jgi:hypothetical protein